ncbi:hypothetical protein PLESTM_000703200 [Pleodorina starrii]|nr:hypothetical protein PLESTM_000703200 [Pleodorina starrii]
MHDLIKQGQPEDISASIAEFDDVSYLVRLLGGHDVTKGTLAAMALQHLARASAAVLRSLAADRDTDRITITGHPTAAP